MLVALLVLVSVVAFAGSAAGAIGSGDGGSVTVQTDRQVVETTLAGTATVTGNSTLYDRGESVSDQPVYLRSATPNLTVVATTAVPQDRAVNVTHAIALELTATRDGEVFWSERRVLTRATTRVTDGTARTTATLDVAALARERLSTVRAETDGVGTIETRLAVDAEYDTGSYAGNATASAPLAITDRAYEFDTPQTTRQIHTTPAERPAAASEAGLGLPGTSVSVPARSVWWGFVGLAALGAAVLVRRVDRGIDDFDAFQRRYERQRYGEWISRGRIPNTGRYVRVPVESLLDLVDIAIDTDKRVIHDESRDIYAVVDGNLLYEFRDHEDTGWMYEFGLAPVGDESPPRETPDDAFQRARAAAENGDGDLFQDE